MNRRQTIDPRIKLTLLPLVGFISFFIQESLLLLPLAAFAFFLFAYSRMYKSGLGYLGCLLCLLLGEEGLHWLENPNLIFGIYMILYFLSRMTLIAMFGVYITKSTQVSEMVEGLSRMKVPGYIRIPFSVLLRFAPTMRHEIRALQENMKIRGVVSGRWFLLRHPIKYAEYTLIPLLMRAIKIADELSASALIRGLDSKDKRISPVDLNPKMMDALFSVAGVLTVLGTVILQNYM